MDTVSLRIVALNRRHAGRRFRSITTLPSEATGSVAFHARAALPLLE